MVICYCLSTLACKNKLLYLLFKGSMDDKYKSLILTISSFCTQQNNSRLFYKELENWRILLKSYFLTLHRNIAYQGKNSQNGAKDNQETEQVQGAKIQETDRFHNMAGNFKSSHQPKQRDLAEHLRCSAEIPERPFLKRKDKLALQ